MTASRLHPNVWKGEERSSGYIARNVKPKSASSPDWRGRIYLVGAGWFWLSGWVKDTKDGPMLSLRAEEMTDEQAEKFCVAKVRTNGAAPAATRRQLFVTDGGQAPPPGRTDDIPF